MKSKKVRFWPGRIVLVVVVGLVLTACGGNGDEKAGCGEGGGISLDFSSLPAGNLVMFTAGKVTGIRLYDKIMGGGTSLWCSGSQESPPGSGKWKDAAVILFFCGLSCDVGAITTEVHGHGNQARISATQKDGTTQTVLCPGDKQVLTLNAAEDNPFIYAVLSGREAEWISLTLH